jgi:dihydroxy-acid dehydratase
MNHLAPARNLRSGEWFRGTSESSVAHRAAMRAAGLDVDSGGSSPIIAIIDTASDTNPCNIPCRELIPAVSDGIRCAGGVPAVVPVLSLGEDLMKPSAMLYRNLASMDVEEALRAYPFDGVVLLANCDKTIPAGIMGAVSANLPTIVALGGSRPDTLFNGSPIRSGTDLWLKLDDFRAGRMDAQQWGQFEECYSCTRGACNVMGTASTMALIAEALGLVLAGTSIAPADDPKRVDHARQAGIRIVELVDLDVRPFDILDRVAFERALTALCLAGGSTNALLHLTAIAGRVGLDLPTDWINDIAELTPVLADVVPAGRHLIGRLHEAGGLPELFRAFGSVPRATGPTVSAPVADGEVGGTADSRPRAEPPTGPMAAASRANLATQPLTESVIRPLSHPVYPDAPFVMMRGSLAPDGALLKASSASPRLFRHRGPALVFNDYHRMRHLLDDPEFDVHPDSILVLAGAGPVGVPGMPEWGMIPIPAALARRGITDMVRVTDARMSGTSFGTCFLHVAPEAAIGGPLALVRTGDPIEVNVHSRRLDLAIPARELQQRKAAWSPPRSPHVRGWPALYQQTVTQAPQGCDLTFLRADLSNRDPVPPVVGRS